MSEPLVTHLTGLFQAELDSKNQIAMQHMAAKWLKVEDRLRAEIELLAAELAAPPGQPVKLDPITEMVMKMQQAGYAPAQMQQLLATQGIFKIPEVPQPQAKQLKAWQLAKLQRYVRLLAQTQQEIERFTGTVATPVIDQLLVDSAFDGLAHALSLIEVSVGAGGGDVIDLGFDRLGIEAAQNIVAIAGAGKPLGDLLHAAYPLAANGITDRLIHGTAVGWNPRKTARAIINEGLAQGLNHMLLVARDQQNRSYREATRRQYLQAGIPAYRRLAAKQTRTCLACLALDGQVFPTEELMALHPQDRCTMVAIIPGLEPIQFTTGQEWFETQPAEVQRQMLGPGKYAAWKAGKFNFQQLVTVKRNDIWGPNAQVTSLKDLLEGKGGFTPPPLPKTPPGLSGPLRKPTLPSLPANQPGPSPLPALDHDALQQLDLHQVGPGWGKADDWQNQSYGGIIFDAQGRVLLRKPKGNFDGYAWTFPKGRMDGPGEHPVLTALREVEQESGHDGAIIGLLPGQYQAGSGGTKNNFFLMKSQGFDAGKLGNETEDLIWATWSEAQKLIQQGQNKAGVKRDIKILNSAIVAHGDLETGFATNDYLFKTQKSKPAIITTFNDALTADLKKQAGNIIAKSAMLDIEQNGKGLAVLDGQGKLKAVASITDDEDNYIAVSAVWAENQVSGKTALINAGKLAAKQGKGIVIQTNPSIFKAAETLGFEPGGDNKAHPAGTYFLPPDWIKAWAKAPTQFSKLKVGLGLTLPPPPPPPKTVDRFSLPGGDPTTDDLGQIAQQALADPLAKKGATAALDKIKGGQKGFVYSDKSTSNFKGVISYEDQGGIIKVGSAGFADFETNLVALEDVVKVAKQGGKDLVTFAPNGPILDQYKKWGFETNNTYTNGQSLILKQQNFDAWLKDPEAHGKAVATATPAPKTTPTPGPRPLAPAFKATPRPRQPEPIPDPQPLPEPDDFPPDPDTLKLVRKLGGSTGAELVKGDDGKLYVRKRGGSAEHITEEAYADAGYLAAGANVPRFRLYNTPAGPVKLAEFIEGQALGEVLKKGGKKAEAAGKAAQEMFAADALLSNRDAVGLDYDNMLVDREGRVWRIDNGGSFRFRAQGTRKQDWDEYPTDFWTLRDKSINLQTGDVFGGLDFYAVADQVLELGRRRTAILAAAPAEVQEVLARRLDHIRDMATTGKAMQSDDFRVDYADSFSRQRLEIRRTGIREQMPLAMDVPGYEKTPVKARYTGIGVDTEAVYDEAGRKFDRLRGPNSLVGQLRDFVHKSGGDYSLIVKWAEAQAGSSWSAESQAFKFYITQAMGKPESQFWWRDGRAAAEGYYKSIARDPAVYDRTFKALHAFNQELLSRMDLPNKDEARGTVRLFRSEVSQVTKKGKVKPGDKDVTMPRGAVESTSIFDAVYISTTELTRQHVPLHRVIGTYLMEREPGVSYGMFAGDHENEFVVILGGDLPFDYVATQTGQKILIQD